MKEIVLTVILLLTCNFFSSGQSSFQKTFGGGDQDAGYSVKQVPGGGYIVAGATKSFVMEQGGAYLIRTNSSGDTLWTRTYGGVNNWEDASSVQLTDDGGFIFTGGAASFGNGREDVYLVKVDANGEVEWSETIGGGADDRGNWLEKTNDGGYIITGSTMSYGAGESDICLLKTDSQGNVLWTRTFGGDRNDVGKCVIQTGDNGFLILAEAFIDGNDQLLLIKTDPEGNVTWSESLQGRNGNEIAQTPDGGYVITGSVFTADQALKIFLYKVDEAGTLLWARTYGGHTGESVVGTEDGGFIVLGDSSDIVRNDADGNVMWSKRYGNPGTENLSRGMCRTQDNGYILTGQKYMPSHDFDLLLCKADPSGKSGCTDVSFTRTAVEIQPAVMARVLSASTGGMALQAMTHGNKIGTAIQTLGEPLSGFTFQTDSTLNVTLYKSSFNDLTWNWDFGDGTSDSVYSTVYHTYTDTGSYNVCLTVRNTCGSDSYCRIFTFSKPGAIGEKNLQAVKAYPDPAKEFIVLDINNGSKKDLSLDIFNSTGKCVLKIDHVMGSKVKINREQLSGRGLYLFTMKDNKGFQVSGKFIFE
jgi:hypothetical protein